jgi:hypothetical protein
MLLAFTSVPIIILFLLYLREVYSVKIVHYIALEDSGSTKFKIFIAITVDITDHIKISNVQSPTESRPKGLMR